MLLIHHSINHSLLRRLRQTVISNMLLQVMLSMQYNHAATPVTHSLSRSQPLAIDDDMADPKKFFGSEAYYKGELLKVVGKT